MAHGVETRWCVVTYSGGLPVISIFDDEETARREVILMRNEEEATSAQLMGGSKPRKGRRIHVVSADHFTNTNQ